MNANNTRFDNTSGFVVDTGRDPTKSNFNEIVLRIDEDSCNDCIGSWTEREWQLQGNGWKANTYRTEKDEYTVYSAKRADTPPNSVLGAWSDSRWVCAPGTGYCRRRLALAERRAG